METSLGLDDHSLRGLQGLWIGATNDSGEPADASIPIM
jgi:hypothetical protein